MRFPPPLFKGSGGLATVCHKIQPTREKNQSTVCMCFCVTYVPVCLHIHAVCVQVYTCLYVRGQVCVCVCLYVSLETPLVRGGRSLGDGNKI